MRLIEALEVALEHLIGRFEHLHFSQRKLRVQTNLHIVKFENVFADRFNLKFFHQVFDVVLPDQLRVVIFVVLLSSLPPADVFAFVVADTLFDLAFN